MYKGRDKHHVSRITYTKTKEQQYKKDCATILVQSKSDTYSRVYSSDTYKLHT